MLTTATVNLLSSVCHNFRLGWVISLGYLEFIPVNECQRFIHSIQLKGEKSKWQNVTIINGSTPTAMITLYVFVHTTILSQCRLVEMQLLCIGNTYLTKIFASTEPLTMLYMTLNPTWHFIMWSCQKLLRGKAFEAYYTCVLNSVAVTFL